MFKIIPFTHKTTYILGFFKEKIKARSAFSAELTLFLAQCSLCVMIEVVLS